MYLLHPLPILLYVASTKEIQQLDHFYLVRSDRFLYDGDSASPLRNITDLHFLFKAIVFLGIWTLSHMLAYITHLIVELPFAGLEKLLKSKECRTHVVELKFPMPNFSGPPGANPSETRADFTVCTGNQRYGFDSGMVTRYKF